MHERIATGRGADYGHDLLRFELYENLDPPTATGAVKHAQAKIFTFGGATPGDYLTLANPLVDLYDPLRRHFGLIGERGWMRFSGDSGRWEIVEMEGGLIRHGKVYGAAIAALGSGTVRLWAPNGAGTETATGYDVTAREFGDKIRAEGERVFVAYEPAAARWYIVDGGGKAKTIRATLYESLASTDSSKLVALSGARGYDGFLPPGTTLAAYQNDIGSLRFTGSTGATCELIYRPEDDKYYFSWVACP